MRKKPLVIQLSGERAEEFNKIVKEIDLNRIGDLEDDLLHIQELLSKETNLDKIKELVMMKDHITKWLERLKNKGDQR